MKCRFCGAETQPGKFCEYCGSELPQEKPTINITNNYYGDAAPQTPSEPVGTHGRCPKCGGNMVSFSREKNRAGSQTAYRTVGLCRSCGHTWEPNNGEQKSAGKNTWLWVLGWIFIFPLPLTILLLRNKEMKPLVKYGIIIVAWLIYFAIGLSPDSEAEPPATAISAYTESIQLPQNNTWI